KVLVEHVMMVKKNVKPNPQRNIKGGIAEQETPISLSNVMIVCPTCGPSRICHELRGEKRVRTCRKCNAPLDKYLPASSYLPLATSQGSVEAQSWFVSGHEFIRAATRLESTGTLPPRRYFHTSS